MKILFAATPAPGHINPILALARLARARGDDARFVSSRIFRGAIEAAGARFVPLAEGAELDYRRIDRDYPERAQLPPGPLHLKHDFEKVFLDTMGPQAETLRAAVAAEAPDVIVTDSLFCGTAPLFLDRERPRPPIVHCGVTFLPLDRPDGAPSGPGLPPARDAADRARYAAIAAQVDAVVGGPLRAYADARLAALGAPPLPCSVWQAGVDLADAYLQPTVPDFEYDFGPLPPTVHFVGALPAPPSQGPQPDWWGDLDGGRKVVLVTQGTVANADLGQLIEPTLTALADRDDLLVVATTGGRPLDQVRAPIPGNARLATFLDFAELLPRVDLVVTNGGYSTVSLALRAGVPLVAAGATEDKPEIGARVAWSGVGINLATSTPTVAALGDAAGRGLADPAYRSRARTLAARFAALDTPRLIFDQVDRLVGEPTMVR